MSEVPLYTVLALRIGSGVPLGEPLLTPALSEHFLQGYLAHKKTLTLLGPPSAPRHRPTVGSWGVRFLVSEVPLYGRKEGRFMKLTNTTASTWRWIRGCKPKGPKGRGGGAASAKRAGSGKSE